MMGARAQVPESSSAQALRRPPESAKPTGRWRMGRTLAVLAHSTAPMVDPSVSNKANPGPGGLGIDYGLRIIDDLEPPTPGAVLRQTKPISPAMCLGLPKGHPQRTPHGVTTSAPNKPNFTASWPENEVQRNKTHVEKRDCVPRSAIVVEDKLREGRLAALLAMAGTLEGPGRQKNPIGGARGPPGGDRVRQTKPIWEGGDEREPLRLSQAERCVIAGREVLGADAHG